jgi:hypothetical protein
MNIKLIAKSPFRDYKKGDQIVDQEEIKKILESHEHKMVVKTVRGK